MGNDEPNYVILRAAADGMFEVFDHAGRPLAGPLTLPEALACADQHGALTIYEQDTEASGRIPRAPRPFRPRE